jgi:hypothetical protein
MQRQMLKSKIHREVLLGSAFASEADFEVPGSLATGEVRR